MLRLAGAALLMAVSTPAYASDWYFISAAKDLANISFVDKDSIRDTGDGSTHASMFALLAAPQDGVLAYRFEIAINCGKRESRLISAETYDEAHQPMGEDAMEDEWKPIAPNSQGAPVADFICGKGKLGADNLPAGRALPFETGKAMLIAQGNTK